MPFPTYVCLIESPQELFAVRTERGLAEKFRNEFMAINFVDSAGGKLILRNFNLHDLKLTGNVMKRTLVAG